MTKRINEPVPTLFSVRAAMEMLSNWNLSTMFVRMRDTTRHATNNSYRVYR